ncbi:MAG TPA: hypothetical protein VN281_02530 [Verrucomicrobiae bacterium]|jgi:hypothetical protein|nr:hypothetical protein [Verrucomicrobiae bacterium]
MKTKSVLWAVLVVAVAVGLFLRNHRSQRAEAARQTAPISKMPLPERALTPTPVPAVAPVVVDNSSDQKPPPTKAPEPATKSDTRPQPVGVDLSRPADTKPEIQDPVARLALRFVGINPGAEDYWISAINDPTLPPEERRDLIEDLNEDGISDPHHPAAEDMPLIASRIVLIEQLAPYAADQVNADAFKEAYKDLVNLLNGLPAD